MIADRLWSDTLAEVLAAPMTLSKDAKANAAAYKAKEAARDRYDLMFPKD